MKYPTLTITITIKINNYNYNNLEVLTGKFLYGLNSPSKPFQILSAQKEKKIHHDWRKWVEYVLESSEKWRHFIEIHR